MNRLDLAVKLQLAYWCQLLCVRNMRRNTSKNPHIIAFGFLRPTSNVSCCAYRTCAATHQRTPISLLLDYSGRRLSLVYYYLSFCSSILCSHPVILLLFLPFKHDLSFLKGVTITIPELETSSSQRQSQVTRWHFDTPFIGRFAHVWAYCAFRILSYSDFMDFIAV